MVSLFMFNEMVKHTLMYVLIYLDEKNNKSIKINQLATTIKWNLNSIKHKFVYHFFMNSNNQNK